MNEYAKRTCHKCGIKRPQPEMVRSQVYSESGKSKTGVSGATWVGAFLGSKQSTRSVGSWLFNAGQRTYSRKREVWLCPSCSGVLVGHLSTQKGKSIGKKILLGLFVLWLAVIVIDDMTRTPKQNTTISSP